MTDSREVCFGTIRIGTAGWTIPGASAAAFSADGTQLKRYAGRLPCVEINSSFYRPHRPATYARWAGTVPAAFRFAVKMPREISHDRRMVDATAPLDRFLSEVRMLGDRLGPLLLQLPPSLRHQPETAAAFFAALRQRFAGAVVCEPRHPSWFTAPVDALLTQFRIARVAADPAPVPEAARPAGWMGLAYWRLHGSPRMYYSDYGPDRLDAIAGDLRTCTAEERWCIFDNTALGCATANAFSLATRC